MSARSTTHEVLNQPPPLEDVNLFDRRRANRRSGAGRRGQAAAALDAFGKVAGSAEALERGRLANEITPKLETHDRHGTAARHGRLFIRPITR